MSLAHDRDQFFNASDAPAMLGISPYETRQALLERIKYGVGKAITPAVQAIFDSGHRIEALARPIAEALLGHPLPPKRFTKGSLGATLDGYYLDPASLDAVNWECKSLNESIREAFLESPHPGCFDYAIDGVELPEYLCAQMEQQLICSDAEKCLLTARNDDECVHCWYYPDTVMRRRIIDGWAQFERDLAAMPDVMPHAIVGELMPVVREFPVLPSLRFGLVGGALSDVLRFEAEGRTFISTINQSLVSDQDFADGENDKTDLANAVKMLDVLIDSPQDLAALKRVRELFNKARISLENQLTTRKQTRKNELIKAAQWAYSSHISALDVAEYMPLVNVDFAGAIKGKSSFSAMQNTLDAEVLRAISGSNSVAARVRENLAMLAQANAGYLFPDARMLVLKDIEDVANTIKVRLTEHAAKVVAANFDAKLKTAEREQEAALSAKFGPITPAQSMDEYYANERAPESASASKINLSQINERLNVVSVTTAQLVALGFPGVEGPSKGASVWPESDLLKIKAEIIKRFSK